MLFRYDPFRDLDRLLDEVSSGRATPRAMPMDVFRAGDHFEVLFDLPGVDPQSVELSLENNVLTVRAQRSRRAEEGAEYLVAERPTGSYTRQLALGDGLDLDRLTASYDNGVLMLTIPVAEQAKPRKIEVGLSGQQPRVIEHQQRTEVGG